MRFELTHHAINAVTGFQDQTDASFGLLFQKSARPFIGVDREGAVPVPIRLVWWEGLELNQCLSGFNQALEPTQLPSHRGICKVLPSPDEFCSLPSQDTRPPPDRYVRAFAGPSYNAWVLLRLTSVYDGRY